MQVHLVFVFHEMKSVHFKSHLCYSVKMLHMRDNSWTISVMIYVKDLCKLISEDDILLRPLYCIQNFLLIRSYLKKTCYCQNQNFPYETAWLKLDKRLLYLRISTVYHIQENMYIKERGFHHQIKTFLVKSYDKFTGTCFVLK